MKTKFGSIIVAGSGKIGGHVASKNKSGSYLRTKVTPTNPRTNAQSGVRALLASLAQQWRSLTQDQRDAWNAAVSSFAKTNIFGDLVNPSGFNLFQKLNNNLININRSVITDPPMPAEIGTCDALSLTVAVAVPALSLVMANAVPANTAVKVFATAPQSAGISNANSAFRQISVLAAAAATPVNLLAAYVAKFGSTGAVGQKIFVKIVPCSTISGQDGGATSVSAISVA
jgi:hypothetical protein